LKRDFTKKVQNCAFIHRFFTFMHAPAQKKRFLAVFFAHPLAKFHILLYNRLVKYIFRKAAARRPPSRNLIQAQGEFL